MAKKKIDLSLIIPAFNEEKRLPKRFPKAWQEIKKQLTNFELIFINDGSKDKTEEILKKLTKVDKRIKFISYFPNHGKGYAVKKGVEMAQGEIIGFTDADFAIELKQLTKTIEYIKKGTDIVIGNRKTKQAKLKSKPDLLRRFLSIIHSQVNNFFLELGPIKDTLCGYKFFKASVAKKIFANLSIYRWFFDLEVLIKSQVNGYKILQLPVKWEEIGGSKVTYLSMIKSSVKEHLTIYGHFFNLKIFSALTLGLLFLLFLPFWFGPKNLTQRNGDYSDLVWPDYYFIKQTILNDHQIPLWNPTLFSGIPEIANPQSPLIYPPNVLALIFPIDYAMILLAILHSLICGIFLYKIGKEIFGWSSISSTILAYAYIFSPFVISKIAVGHLSMSFAIFLVGPIIYFTLLLLQKIKFISAFWLSFFLAAQYLNYPTIWYYNLFFGLPVLFAISFWQKKIKNFLFIIATLIFSLFLISPILALQLQAGPLITRSSLNIHDLAIPIWSISRFLKSVLVPSNFLFDNETEVWLYPGLMALILGGLGLLKLKKELKLIAIVVLLLVVILTLGNRTPIFGLFSNYVPGFSYLRVVTRDWFIFILTIAYLGAFCLSKIKRYQFFFAILIFLDLFIFSILRLWFIPPTMGYFATSSINNLISSDRDYRYYCTSRCLSAKETVPQKVITADGYHLLILKDYRLAISDAGGFSPPEYTGNLPTYSVTDAQPSAQKLGKMAIKWVISTHLLTDSDFVMKKSNNGYTLFENTQAKKRLFFQNNPNNLITVQKDTPNEIILYTSGPADTLVIADSFYPGWEVFIDGKKGNLTRYEGWARSVVLTEGEHIIKLEFKPFQNLFSR